MLQVSVVTLFPEMFAALTQCGVTGKAVESGLLSLSLVNPRDYAADKRRSVDDRPYGGGPGMVMSVAPLQAAIRAARAGAPGARVACLSPQGRRVEQRDIEALAAQEALIFVAGRYEGIDERLIELEVDEEWSIGDYVLSGGELPAMVLIDAMARRLPSALGNAESAQADSFCRGMLDYPHYTRPESVAGRRAPAALLSGDHEAVRKWRLKQALGRTWKRRPELLEGLALDASQKALLDEYIGAEARQDEPTND